MSFLQIDLNIKLFDCLLNIHPLKMQLSAWGLSFLIIEGSGFKKNIANGCGEHRRSLVTSTGET